MDKGRAVPVVAVFLLLAVLATGLLFLYPVGGDSPAEFTMGSEATYVSSGSISITDDFDMRYEATVLGENGAHIEQIHGDGVSESETFYRGNATYTKFVSESDDEWLDRQADRSGREVIHADQTVLVTAEPASDDPVHAESQRALVFTVLEFPSYAEVEAESDGETTVYRPEETWVQNGEQYRVTDASGWVKTDAETGVVTAADVEFRVTEASSYAEYLRNDAELVSVEYAFDPDPDADTVAPPAWVTDCVDGDECDF